MPIPAAVGGACFGGIIACGAGLTRYLSRNQSAEVGSTAAARLASLAKRTTPDTPQTKQIPNLGQQTYELKDLIEELERHEIFTEIVPKLRENLKLNLDTQVKILLISGSLEKGYTLECNLDTPLFKAVRIGTAIVQTKPGIGSNNGVLFGLNTPSENPYDLNQYSVMAVSKDGFMKALDGEPMSLTIGPNAAITHLNHDGTSDTVRTLAEIMSNKEGINSACFMTVCGTGDKAIDFRSVFEPEAADSSYPRMMEKILGLFNPETLELIIADDFTDLNQLSSEEKDIASDLLTVCRASGVEGLKNIINSATPKS